MKKFIVISLMALAATSTFAASPTVLQAVLASKAVANVQDVEKVEVIATYRCPNCFDVQVSGQNLFGDAYVKVRTEQTSAGLKISLLESSK